MEWLNPRDLIPHERNSDFFDDITGDSWIEFLRSIESSGIVEPIVVTPELLIVSGHQRIRAALELELKEVPCRIKVYKSKGKLSLEDVILKDLLETNLRQRGIGNVNPMKYRACLRELERIYDVRQGSGGNKYNYPSLGNLSQEQIAKAIGISPATYQRFKSIDKLAPELQDLIESGKLGYSVAAKCLASMEIEDQRKLLEIIGEEKIKEVTGPELQALRKQIEEVKTEKAEAEKQLLLFQEQIASVEEIKKNAAENETRLKEELETARRTLGNFERRLSEDEKLRAEEIEEMEQLKAQVEELESQEPEKVIFDDYEDLKKAKGELEAKIEVLNSTKAIDKDRESVKGYLRGLIGDVGKYMAKIEVETSKIKNDVLLQEEVGKVVDYFDGVRRRLDEIRF